MPAARRDRDELLAAALAAGKTYAEAGQVAGGVSERTVYKRLAEPGFRARVAELRAAVVARAAGQLADGMCAAAATLRELLGSQSEGVRLRAAVAIIDLGVRVAAVEELQRRVEELERGRST